MTLRIACVLDPLAGLVRGHDTSLAILEEAERCGHDVHTCGIGDLLVREGELFVRTSDLAGKRTPAWHRSEEFSLIFMRKDPPVDRAYLQATYLLDLAACPVWNSPSGLREASEKLFAMRFPGVFPPTLITQDKLSLFEFLDEMGGQMVVKPVDGYAGKGVFFVRRDDPNRAAILEAVTEEWRRPVMAQQFLPRVAEGDKRILLLDGEPVGAVVRLARAGEFRANMAAGGTVRKSEVSARERELIETIRPGLLEWGLHFVGLDVIGDYITEINVTSPTMLVEISKLDDRDLAGEVIGHWEREFG